MVYLHLGACLFDFNQGCVNVSVCAWLHTPEPRALVLVLVLKADASLSLQAECLLTRRTPPVCWGCVAELWCFSPSLSSGTRLTLCKKHFQFWPLMQFSCCSYIHWMLVDVIIYKIHEWIHFLWKLWRPSEDTFFAQIIDYFKFDVNWFLCCVGL